MFKDRIQHHQSSKDLSQILTDTPVLSSQSLNWRGVRLEQRQHFVPELVAPPMEEHFLTFHIGNPVHLFQKRDGQIHKGLIASGDITFMPAGHESVWREDAASETLYLYLNPALVDRLAETSDLSNKKIELINNFGTRDPHISHLIIMLQSEMQSGGLYGQVYVESLLTALIIRLLRQYSTQRATVKEYTDGLSKPKLDKALEYIHAHLDETISLEAIAQTLDLNQYYFARLFAKSMGVPPYQYVIEQRLGLAKRLLKQPDNSIADVAYSCGFPSHSQFSKFFRKYMGTSPSKYQKQQ